MLTNEEPQSIKCTEYFLGSLVKDLGKKMILSQLLGEAPGRSSDGRYPTQIQNSFTDLYIAVARHFILLHSLSLFFTPLVSLHCIPLPSSSFHCIPYDFPPLCIIQLHYTSFLSFQCAHSSLHSPTCPSSLPLTSCSLLSLAGFLSPRGDREFLHTTKGVLRAVGSV